MSLTGWLITSNARAAVLLRTAILQDEVADVERAEEGSGEKEAVLPLMVVVSWLC